jgi:hypothetical protein
MSEPMSHAELDAHIAELLPQRTVLSLLSLAGSARHGEPGTQHAQDHSIPSSTWWMIFGYYPPSTDPAPGSAPAPSTAHSFGIGDAYSRHS